jgi:putative ABC transport system permease protein
VTVPTDYNAESMIEALRQPYSVAVDQTALKRLGVKKGDKALYNGKTITIGVVTHRLSQHHSAHPGDVARHPAHAGRG